MHSGSASHPRSKAEPASPIGCHAWERRRLACTPKPQGEGAGGVRVSALRQRTGVLETSGRTPACVYSSPMSTVNLHDLAEERSIALHAAVAERLRAEPSLLDPVRARVLKWLQDGSVHARYARDWAAILARPLAEILPFLTDPGEHARALRQVTPFTGILDQQERLRIRAEVRLRLGV